MSESVKDLNPNVISHEYSNIELTQEDHPLQKEKFRKGNDQSVNVSDKELNLTTEDIVKNDVLIKAQHNPRNDKSETSNKIKQRKKVAKVKPNPRHVESLSVGRDEIEGQETVDGGPTVSPETSRHVTPLGKICSNSTSPIFESGVNTECIQLIRQLWNLHEEALDFLHRISSLSLQCQRRLRLIEVEVRRNSKTNAMGKLRETFITTRQQDLTPLEPMTSLGSKGPLLSLLDLNENEMRKNGTPFSISSFIFGLKSITENVAEIEKQFNILSIFYAQCKLVLFAKVLQARKYVSHDHLSILHTVNQLIIGVIHLISSTPTTTPTSEEMIKENLVSIFQLTEVYNASLESTFQTQNLSQATVVIGTRGTEGSSEPVTSKIEMDDETNFFISKVRILRQMNGVIQNDMPSLKLSLKPLSAIKLLSFFLQKRVLPASRAFTNVLHSNFLNGIYGTRNTSPLQHILTISTELSLKKFEHCFLDEDNRIGPFTKGLSGTPSLLGRAAIKKSENGEQRVSKSVRRKIYNYSREMLWNSVGEISNDLLLWSFDIGLPLVLFPLHIFSDLRNSLSLGGQISENKLSPILSAFDSISSSLHSYTILATWDEKMRACFDMALKVKRPEHIHLQRNPIPGEWATSVGRTFGDIVTTCVTLMDGQGPELNESSTIPSISNTSSNSLHSILHNQNESQQILEERNLNSKLRFGFQSEEEPLSDEAQLLFRLEATFFYFMCWTVKRTKTWLNNWAIPQFLASSQRDSKLLSQLMKSRESILITRVILLTNESTSVRISAKQRQICADELRETLNLLSRMPDDLLEAVGPICETLSLATLQSCMPNPKHWQGIGPWSGLTPDKPSQYVHVFINRVIDPAVVASVEFLTPSTQEAMGKQVIHAASEAWLQHILQKKIRFSEWGAVQLLRDFMTFRDWIRNETLLAEEARKAILKLEILKRCEGVAYLLLRSPGDVLGVGKASSKTRRHSSNVAHDSHESSPSVSESSIIAEGDIPPEMYVTNQQMWLELRLRRNTLSLSSCC